MLTCECCGGNCDHGELVQGICAECRDLKKRKKEGAASIEDLMSDLFYQMELNLEGMENARSHNTSGGI